MPDAVNDADFANEVLATDGPVLVDFWAEWCAPCKAMDPILDRLSQDLSGKVRIVKLNVDENPATAIQYGVRSMPTMIVFKDGQPTDMKVGAMPASALTKWVESHTA